MHQLEMVKIGGTIIFATCSLATRGRAPLNPGFSGFFANVRRDPLDANAGVSISDMITGWGPQNFSPFPRRPRRNGRFLCGSAHQDILTNYLRFAS